MRACGLLLCWMGCAGPAGPGGDTDCPGDTATQWACGAAVALQVGTGEEAYTLLDGGTLPLIKGNQGAQHVFISLRAPWSLDTLPLDRAQATVSIWDGAVRVAPALVLGVGLQSVDQGVEVAGLRVVIDPPVVDREVRITAALAPVGMGEEARGTTTGTIRWADDG